MMPTRKLTRRIEANLHAVQRKRPVVTAANVVLAGPDEMHGGPTANCFGNFGKLNHPITAGIATAEATAAEDGVDLDLLRCEAKHRGRGKGVGAVRLAT